jgi:hypothetical protein
MYQNTYWHFLSSSFFSLFSRSTSKWHRVRTHATIHISISPHIACRLLELLRWRLGTLALGGYLAVTQRFPYVMPFAQLSLAARERILQGWANSPVPLLLRVRHSMLPSTTLKFPLDGYIEHISYTTSPFEPFPVLVLLRAGGGRSPSSLTIFLFPIHASQNFGQTLIPMLAC